MNERARPAPHRPAQYLNRYGFLAGMGVLGLTLRSLALWLLALPFALKGTMAPGTVAMSAFATAYVYVGIEELGVQVEQPFELIPMTRICAIVTANVEEAFSAPPDTK